MIFFELPQFLLRLEKKYTSDLTDKDVRGSCRNLFIYIVSWLFFDWKIQQNIKLHYLRPNVSSRVEYLITSPTGTGKKIHSVPKAIRYNGFYGLPPSFGRTSSPIGFLSHPSSCLLSFDFHECDNN